MKTIQLSDRKFKVLKDRAEVYGMTPEQYLSQMIKEQIEETVPAIFEEQ